MVSLTPFNPLQATEFISPILILRPLAFNVFSRFWNLEMTPFILEAERRFGIVTFKEAPALQTFNGYSCMVTKAGLGKEEPAP